MKMNPAAEAAPAPAATAPQFDLADGIVASVNDRIITGYDLRQRMLMLILSSEIQPTQENLPAIQQAALNALSMCQFKPGMNNGVPEAGWGQIAYVWKLEE